ncbi:MAG: hypothetical protein ABIR96_09625 [Bdellovibrionota bacterium]
MKPHPLSSSWSNPQNWRYVLLEGSPEGQDAALYSEAYRLWKEVWGATFHEVDSTRPFFSDNFSRQNEIGALFSGNRCLMLSGFRKVDLELSATRDDSYFAPWSDASLQTLKREGRVILIGNQITLDPQVRGKDFGPSMKDLIVSLSIARFLDSPCSAMAGSMRSLKGMNTLAIRHGATLIPQEIEIHGETSEIFAFYRSSYSAGIPLMAELAQTLWQSRQNARLPHSWQKKKVA